MDISGYLAELIQTNTKVVVPGFGTFYKEEKPASYDPQTAAFIPPAETIVFKNEFDSDTTLLNYISQKENIEIDSVAFLVEQYANNLNDILSSTEFIKIDVLGTFEKNGEGYTFNPDPKLLSNKYFGLSPQKEVHATAHQSEKVEPEIEHEVTEEFDEQAAPRSYQNKILLLLIILLGGLIYVQLYHPDLISSTWDAMVKPKTAIAPATPEPKEITTPADTIVPTDSTLKADTAVQKAELNTEQESYEIVIAAFGKRSEADAYIQQMAARNIKAHSLPNKPKEFIKISIGTFNDEKSAQTELKRVQSDLSKGAWIYHLKPTKNQENVSTTN